MVKLEIKLGENLCSFKNHKRVTANGGLMTDRKVKARMDRLEDAIASSLHFGCPTGDAATDLALRRRRQTLLSGLCDDSLNQIPEFAFAVEYVPKGEEGVVIEIEEIP